MTNFLELLWYACIAPESPQDPSILTRLCYDLDLKASWSLPIRATKHSNLRLLLGNAEKPTKMAEARRCTPRRYGGDVSKLLPKHG